MNVLLIDKLSASAVSALEKLGLQVEVRGDLNGETLPGAVGHADILIVRSTKVTAATIQAAPRLGLIVRAGAGPSDTPEPAPAGAGAETFSRSPGWLPRGWQAKDGYASGSGTVLRPGAAGGDGVEALAGDVHDGDPDVLGALR